MKSLGITLTSLVLLLCFARAPQAYAGDPIADLIKNGTDKADALARLIKQIKEKETAVEIRAEFEVAWGLLGRFIIEGDLWAEWDLIVKAALADTKNEMIGPRTLVLDAYKHMCLHSQRRKIKGDKAQAFYRSFFKHDTDFVRVDGAEGFLLLEAAAVKQGVEYDWFLPLIDEALDVLKKDGFGCCSVTPRQYFLALQFFERGRFPSEATWHFDHYMAIAWRSADVRFRQQLLAALVHLLRTYYERVEFTQASQRGLELLGKMGFDEGTFLKERLKMAIQLASRKCGPAVVDESYFAPEAEPST